MPSSLQGFLDCLNVPGMEAYDLLQIRGGPLMGTADGEIMRKVCSHLHLGSQVLFGSGLTPQTLSCSYTTFTGEDGETQNE